MLRLFIALVLIAGPTSAFGQEVFDPGDSDLRIGEKVRVLIDGACTTAPCPGELVKGKLADLSPTSIVVQDGPMRRELPVSRVSFVERPRDRIWNGVLIGFATGFAIGFVGVMSDGCDRGEWCIFSGPSFAAAFGLLTGGIGAGVGAITDAAMSNRRVVFARSPAKSSPIAASSRSISVSVRF